MICINEPELATFSNKWVETIDQNKKGAPKDMQNNREKVVEPAEYFVFDDRLTGELLLV